MNIWHNLQAKAAPLLIVITMLSCLTSLALASTITTTIQLPEATPSGNAAPIWLTGCGVTTSAAPVVYGITWAENADGWLPLWELQLVVSESLAPTGSSSVKNGTLSNTASLTLDTVRPQWGHTYQTTLSVNTLTGATSIHIQDITSQQTVYRGELRLVPQSKTDAVGWPACLNVHQMPTDGPIQASTVVTAPYVPRGLTWTVVEEHADARAYIPLMKFERNTPGRKGILIKTQEIAPGGEVRAKLAWSDSAIIKSVELFRTTAIFGEKFFPFDPSLLKQGHMSITLEYLADGAVQFSETKNILVGSVRLSLEELNATHLATGGLGQILIEADGPLKDYPLVAHAEVTELVWDAGTGRYQEKAHEDITVLDERIDITSAPFRYPLPLPAQFLPSPGLWRVKISAHGGTEDLAMADASNEILIANYPKPVIAPGQPFTVTIIPDTQYYSLVSPQGGHPDMFLRQTQWLAEVAADKNIAFAVHLGDITDHNRSDEWQVAQRSMRVLDGIVPYALTLGNHDIGPPGTRGTGLNTHFPAQQYTGLPSFGGLYESGHLENAYYTYQVAETKFLVVALEFWPRDEVVAWADQVVGSHPDHTVIVITHTYTGSDGKRRSSGYDYSVGKGTGAGLNTGADLWEKFVSRHKNILMVLSGHVPYTAVPRDIGTGDHGNAVYEMLFDFQFDPNGGNGWLGLLHFPAEGNRIEATVYSPYLNDYKQVDKGTFYVPFTIDLAKEVYRRP